MTIYLLDLIALLYKPNWVADAHLRLLQVIILSIGPLLIGWLKHSSGVQVHVLKDVVSIVVWFDYWGVGAFHQVVLTVIVTQLIIFWVLSIIDGSDGSRTITFVFIGYLDMFNLLIFLIPKDWAIFEQSLLAVWYFELLQIFFELVSCSFGFLCSFGIFLIVFIVFELFKYLALIDFFFLNFLNEFSF